MLKIFTWIYYNRRKSEAEIKALKDHARDLSQNEDESDENWLFTYEVLPKSDLKDELAVRIVSKYFFMRKIARDKELPQKS